jgi:hypothetical protein
MQQLVTPLLYAELAEVGSTKTLTLFLRTIVERPDLVQYVRSFAGWSFLRYPATHPLGPEQYRHRSLGPRILSVKKSANGIPVVQWSIHDKSAIRTAMEIATKRLNLAYYAYPKRPDETFVDRWARQIFGPSYTYNNSTWDAAVALLLCLLPNLEAIRIDTADEDRQHTHDGVAGFKFVLRVLESSSVSGARLVLPKLHTFHLAFTNCVFRKRLQRSLTRRLGPLKCFHYEAVGMACTWQSSRHRRSEIGFGFQYLRRQLLSNIEDDVEELSVIIRPNKTISNVTLWSRPPTEGIYNINPISSFPKLRALKTSAQMVLGTPYAMWPSQSGLSFERTWQAAVYLPRQEQWFYENLPKRIESLIIVDCPNAIYGCIKYFLKSSHVPHNLKHIELAYTYPTLDKTGRTLAAMDHWMADGDSEWSPMFPGEEFATKQQLEDLARGNGITLIQRIDENYAVGGEDGGTRNLPEYRESARLYKVYN